MQQSQVIGYSTVRKMGTMFVVVIRLVPLEATVRIRTQLQEQQEGQLMELLELEVEVHRLLLRLMDTRMM